MSALYIYEWGKSINCIKGKSREKIGATDISNACLPGPWMETRSNDNSVCNGIHPFPVFFESSIIIFPSIKYEISLFLSWKNKISETVTTIWGFQGVPKIQIPLQDQVFNWQQVYRKGLSSSVTSGQFPMVMYIR